MRDLRFYTPQALHCPQELVLEGETHHHLARVLRLGAGRRIVLFNGDGHDYHGELRSVGKQQSQISITHREALANESPLFLRVYLSLLKGEAFERALQKAVELGAQEIVPLQSQHSDGRWDAARREKKQGHWQGIVIASAMQCGRARLPLLRPVQDFEALLRDDAEQRWIFSPHHASEALPAERPASLALAIGPEGGFSEEEIQRARQSAWLCRQLGPRILRADTAATVAIAQAQFCHGDLPCL